MVKNTILWLLPPSSFSEAGYRYMRDAVTSAGYKISIASISQSMIPSDGTIKVQPDQQLFSIHASNFRALLLTGGDGWIKPFEQSGYLTIIKRFVSAGSFVGAVCSGPVMLARAGVLHNKTAVCNPLYKQELIKAGANYKDTVFHREGNILTGKDADALPLFAQNFLFIIK